MHYNVLSKKRPALQLLLTMKKVDGSQELGDIVFLLTDTMSSRKEIWNAGLRYKMRTSLLIETRMEKDAGMIYTLKSQQTRHIKDWEKTLYED